MTWKQFVHRFNEILADTGSTPYGCTDLEVWRKEQKKITERCLREEQEKQYLIAHWFEQESYTKGSWLKRCCMRIQYLFLDIKGQYSLPAIPAHLRMEMARCLLPDIIAFCESEKGKAELTAWKAEQEAKKEQSKAS